jgi:hypothetical protein
MIGIVIPRQKEPREKKTAPQIIAELKDWPSDADGARTRNHWIDNCELPHGKIAVDVSTLAYKHLRIWSATT